MADSVAKLLLSPEEAAEVLSIGRTRIYHLISTGALRSVQIGRSRRIPARAIDEFVAHLEQATEAGVAPLRHDDPLPIGAGAPHDHHRPDHGPP